MEIIPTPTHKGFIIRDASGDILDVYFKNMFSSFATTKLEGTDIELKPKNSLGSTFDIIKNNVDCGDIQVKWKNMFIQYYDETMLEKKWIVHRKGFTRPRFEVNDDQGTLFLVITPNMNWSKMAFQYHLNNDHPILVL